MILYIHGFLSSPQSFKARLIAARLEQLGLAHAFGCPSLRGEPEEIVAIIERAVQASPDEPALVGSSLGGFYATHVAERFGLRTVLLNPAVRPYELLHDFLGVQRNLYTGEEIIVAPRHLEVLRALDVEPLADPSRYFLIVTTGDEVLDYRQAVEKYRGARQRVIEGGDHSLDSLPAHLDDVLRFCGVAVPPA
ncbi:MAG: alpha/beta fold hydrolase [Betaproteobacteria bacterium]|nr:alpha/beta fold hydrolase [Betaproteobacteria bacterium]